jgi:DHA1 family bicyclomycin/chloramphenicol resistance-like MFS transporter
MPGDTLTVQGARSRRGLIILLGMMSALGPLTTDMYLPALPQISSDFATSDAAVQTTLTGSLLGMALGQLALSPISDGLGRRRPLIAGLGIHVVFSVLSATAPGIGALITFRALQGAGSAAAPAIALAIVRDISVGREASVRYSGIMFVSLAAPIVAPLLGSGLLLWTDWHGIFLIQAAMSAALVIAGLFMLPETQPIRRAIHPGRLVGGLKSVASDRVFAGSALSQAAMMAASFCYISGLSFVAQDWYGLSEQSYGLILSGGAVVMLGMNRLSPLLLRRLGPHQVALTGLAGALASAAAMMAAAPTVGLIGVAICSSLCIGFQQLITPNNRAMGMARHPLNAGIAAALMGASAQAAAGIASPLMGIIGVDNGFHMALCMFSFYGLSMIASTFVIGLRRTHLD